ncbi:MAG: hypothetical protein WCG27_04470, partial [Pseudomonadota bacterium]
MKLFIILILIPLSLVWGKKELVNPEIFTLDKNTQFFSNRLAYCKNEDLHANEVDYYTNNCLKKVLRESLNMVDVGKRENYIKFFLSYCNEIRNFNPQKIKVPGPKAENPIEEGVAFCRQNLFKQSNGLSLSDKMSAARDKIEQDIKNYQLAQTNVSTPVVSQTKEIPTKTEKLLPVKKTETKPAELKMVAAETNPSSADKFTQSLEKKLAKCFKFSMDIPSLPSKRIFSATSPKGAEVMMKNFAQQQSMDKEDPARDKLNVDYYTNNCLRKIVKSNLKTIEKNPENYVKFFLDRCREIEKFDAKQVYVPGALTANSNIAGVAYCRDHLFKPNTDINFSDNLLAVRLKLEQGPVVVQQNPTPEKIPDMPRVITEVKRKVALPTVPLETPPCPEVAETEK